MKKRNLFCAIAVAVALASCSDSEVVPDPKPEPVKPTAVLTISSVSVNTPSKATTTGDVTKWESGDKIGITILKKNANASLTTDKYGTKNNNVVYTYNGISWSGNAVLSDTTGYVYGYYPYSVNQTTKDISLKSGKTDYMYATVSGALNATDSTVNIAMNHAMARLTISHTKSITGDASYSGKGEMTEFRATSTVFATTGTLDYLTGKVTVTKSTTPAEATLLSITDTPKILSSDPITLEYLVIPATFDAEQPMTCKVTVDGTSYETTAQLPKDITTSTHYTISISATSKGLVVGTITANPWNAGDTIPEIEIDADK